MTTIPTGRFVWFDYVSNEPRKAQAFFGELFHWKTKEVPMPGGAYTMIVAGDASIGGYASPPPSNTHWLSYLQVADARGVADRVRSLGGTVVKAPFAIADFATMALVADPLGAAFALWQPRQAEGSGDYTGSDGTWIWNELYSDDPGRSVAFYKAVAGFEAETMKMASGPYELLKTDGKGRAGVMTMHGVQPQWMPYIKVASTDATVARAKQLRAEVKTVETIPGVGRIGVMIDPLGGLLGVLEPQPM